MNFFKYNSLNTKKVAMLKKLTKSSKTKG